MENIRYIKTGHIKNWDMACLRQEYLIEYLCISGLTDCICLKLVALI